VVGATSSENSLVVILDLPAVSFLLRPRKCCFLFADWQIGMNGTDRKRNVAHCCTAQSTSYLAACARAACENLYRATFACTVKPNIFVRNGRLRALAE